MPNRKLLVAIAAVLLLILGAVWLIDRATTPDTETVASAALKGMREQNRLTAFAANYSAVVTSEQTRFGLSAKKTLIMQGLVRYEVDLSKLAANDVRWDASANTLRVRIPEIEVSRPQIDLSSIQEYSEGGILITLTDAEKILDKANREKGEAALIEQARGPVPMRLARDAVRRAITQNFAVPLKAAGVGAKVDAKYGGELTGQDSQWDLSTPLEEIMRK